MRRAATDPDNRPQHAPGTANAALADPQAIRAILPQDEGSQGAIGAGEVPQQPDVTPASVSEARKRKLSEIPRRQRAVFRRAWRGNSRKAAMRAFCLECMGYQAAEVNRCTAPTCPLFPYREGRL